MKPIKYLLPAAGVLALLAAPAIAYDEGTWIVRGGVGTVQPKSDNYSELVDTDIGPVGAELDVDNGTSMTITATYMFNENWALDILGALPFSHDIDAVFTIEGESPLSAPLAETKHLPPTVSIQYHFAPDAAFQPYVGLGANWTTFFSTDFNSSTVAALEAEGILDLEKLSLDDSFGVAAQLGGDWRINDHWLLNIDLRYIDIETDAKVTFIDNTGEVPTSVSGKIGTVEIDPFVYSINLGYRF